MPLSGLAWLKLSLSLSSQVFIRFASKQTDIDPDEKAKVNLEHQELDGAATSGPEKKYEKKDNVV